MKKRNQYIIIIGMILAILGFSTVTYQFAKWKYYDPKLQGKYLMAYNPTYTILMVRYPQGDTFVMNHGIEVVTKKIIPVSSDTPKVGKIYTLYDPLEYDTLNPFKKGRGISVVVVTAVKSNYVQYVLKSDYKTYGNAVYYFNRDWKEFKDLQEKPIQ